MITIRPSWKKGGAAPFLRASLQERLSRIDDGSENLSNSSWFHCLRRGRHDQQDMALALAPALGDGEARFDRLAEVASSASKAPFERGDDSAKSATST